MVALDILRGVRAPLRIFDIRFQTAEIDFWSPSALEMFLPRSLVLTLEKLGLCDFVTDLYGPHAHVLPRNLFAPSPPYLTLAAYPAVRSLQVRFVLRRPTT